MSSMMSALTGDSFEVDNEDLSVDWRTLTSNSRQIRQNKLLGFWTARHYPLFGKKLIGPSWNPPEICNVQVSESVGITEDEIDNIVSKKMKIRIIEVNVSISTSKRLNYFVHAPSGIGKANVTVLSSKMRAFDIESEYLPGCWQALKLGGFADDFTVINFLVKIVINNFSGFSSITVIFTATNELDCTVPINTPLRSNISFLNWSTPNRSQTSW